MSPSVATTTFGGSCRATFAAEVARRRGAPDAHQDGAPLGRVVGHRFGGREPLDELPIHREAVETCRRSSPDRLEAPAIIPRPPRASGRAPGRRPRRRKRSRAPPSRAPGRRRPCPGWCSEPARPRAPGATGRGPHLGLGRTLGVTGGRIRIRRGRIRVFGPGLQQRVEGPDLVQLRGEPVADSAPERTSRAAPAATRSRTIASFVRTTA
jgi:hypothetical protein